VIERSRLGALGLCVVALALSALARHRTAAPAPAPATRPGRAAPEAEVAPEPPAPPRPQLRALRDGQRLDPNRASETELQLLPGVGPTLAHRIAEHRRQHGPFRTLSALTQVSGIGPRTLERMRPLLREPGSIQIEDEDHGGARGQVDGLTPEVGEADHRAHVQTQAQLARQ
jgi:competence protein ComEA